MEHFTLFYSWTLTSNNRDLQLIQYRTGVRAAWIYVLPKTIVTLLTIPLLRQETLLWASLLFLAVSWLSSFVVQIPLQLKVRESADRVALGRLVRTTWVRTVAMMGHCGVVLFVVLGK